MMSASDLKAMYEMERQRAEDNGLTFIEYTHWLESQYAVLESELAARRNILERAVAAAQMRGFERNGWIDSIDYLASLAGSVFENREPVEIVIPPYED